MKERPILFSGPMVRAILEGSKTQTRRVIPNDRFIGLDPEAPDPEAPDDAPRILAECPYGKPGDQLWVREAWKRRPAHWPADWQPGPSVIFAADYSAQRKAVGPWTTPIFMPRWASRITLDLAGVRFERLHAITEEDARAEGLEDRATFAKGWDGINGKRAPWARNPWVWVLSFRRVEP